jgi:hypothetical protein
MSYFHLFTWITSPFWFDLKKIEFKHNLIILCKCLLQLTWKKLNYELFPFVYMDYFPFLI